MPPEDRSPARPLQPVRARRRPARARRCASGPRRAGPPRTGADRHLPRLGARWHRLCGGAARAVHGARHPPGRAEPGARGLRRRGAGEPGHRARRARPDPLDRQFVRLGRRRARRGARGPARGSRRRGHRRRLRDPAQPARVRRLRHHPGPLRRPQRRPRGPRPGRSISARDGFVMGEGRRPARARGGDGRRSPRRDAVRRIARVRGDVRRLPHGPAAGGRPRGGPGGEHRPRRRRGRAGRRSTT